MSDRSPNHHVHAKRKMAEYLDQNKTLKSPYWFDQSDALSRVPAMVAKHRIASRHIPEMGEGTIY